MTATASAFTSTISLTQPRSSEPEAATTPQRVGARAQPLRRDEDYRALPPQRLCVPAVQTQRLLIVSAPRICYRQEDSRPARPSLLPRRRSRNPARAGIHCPSSAGRGRRGDARTTCHSPIGFAGESETLSLPPTNGTELNHFFREQPSWPSLLNVRACSSKSVFPFSFTNVGDDSVGRSRIETQGPSSNMAGHNRPEVHNTDSQNPVARRARKPGSSDSCQN